MIVAVTSADGKAEVRVEVKEREFGPRVFEHRAVELRNLPQGRWVCLARHRTEDAAIRCAQTQARRILRRHGRKPVGG